jgi:hypothetical protein
MATDSTGTKSVTNTFSTTVADSVNLLQAWDRVEIENHDATNEMWARFDGTTAVADANDNGRIKPSGSKVFRALVGPGHPAISVVGSGGQYTIDGVS